MSDDDLIRRGDALEKLHDLGFMPNYPASVAIAALPAVKHSDAYRAGVAYGRATATEDRPALTPTPVDDSLAADPAVKTTLAEALAVLVDCVEDGCYCSEERMAAAVSEARAALARMKGGVA